MFGRTAAVGVGESVYYKAGQSPHSALQLAGVAITNAVADAGLDMNDVDGLVTFMDSHITGTQLASLLGFGNLRFCAQPWSGGGNNGAAAVNLADAAICAGYANTVVVFRSVNQGRQGRFGRARSLSAAENEQAYLAPFGAAAPVVNMALLIRRFMDEFQVSQDALADITLASYAHAQRNPRAIMHGRPLTREMYHASRWIAEPLHLFDCCQENDGAAALVMTTADRAAHLRQPPAYVLAGAAGMEPKGGIWAHNGAPFPRGYKSVGERLWSLAGLKPSDVDVIQFYDSFTGSTLISITDIGFCPPEGVEDFVGHGNLLWPDGRYPLNTSGGNLAEAYMHGFELVNEAVRQVRGQSTCQVDGVELSLSVSGTASPPSSAVLFSNSK